MAHFDHHSSALCVQHFQESGYNIMIIQVLNFTILKAAVTSRRSQLKTLFTQKHPLILDHIRHLHLRGKGVTLVVCCVMDTFAHVSVFMCRHGARFTSSRQAGCGHVTQRVMVV